MTSSNSTFTISRRRIVALSASAVTFSQLRTGGSAEETLDVEVILSNSSKRLAEVESLHFTLAIDGDTYIDESGTILLDSAEGDLARPDKVAVEFKVSLFGVGTVSIRMITIGEDSWTTDLITGKWADAPPEFGYNPAILYDNRNGLGPVMDRIDDPVVTGTEKVDDREAHHIEGIATSDIIGPVTAGTMTGDVIGMELWVDTETFDLLKVKLEESEGDDKENPATWELALSDFDKKVTIEPPV